MKMTSSCCLKSQKGLIKTNNLQHIFGEAQSSPFFVPEPNAAESLLLQDLQQKKRALPICTSKPGISLVPQNRQKS